MVTPTTTTTPTNTGGAPGPTQTGQAANCNRWDLVQDGDSCDVFTKKYPGLTLGDLVEWNPAIGSQCTNLWVDTYVSIPYPHPAIKFHDRLANSS